MYTNGIDDINILDYIIGKYLLFLKARFPQSWLMYEKIVLFYWNDMHLELFVVVCSGP